MKILNKLLIPIILLNFAQNGLSGMKFMPLGQATFNLNKKIKEADTDVKKLELLKTDEFKTIVLRADRLSPADKNALPVIKFIQEKIVPLTKSEEDISSLNNLFKKLSKNKLYPALANIAEEETKAIPKSSKDTTSLELQKIKDNINTGQEKLKQFYKFFGLKENASNAEIDKAYRKLALMFHPDKPLGDQETFKHINNVKEILKAFNDFKEGKADTNQKNILANKLNWQPIPKAIENKVKEKTEDLNKPVME